MRSQRTGERSLFRLPLALTPSTQRKQLADLAAKNHLPAMYGSGAFVEDGGLIGYGVDRDWNSNGPPFSWKRSLEAQSQLICLWSSRRNSNCSLT